MTPATDGPMLVTNRLVSLGSPEVVTSPEPPPARSWITSPKLVVALVVFGIGLRTVPMVQNRNLWIDESMLAINLVERTPAGLLEPLGWNQGAPVGFLLAVKATIMAVGASEWGLRLFPFVGSLLGLIGLAWLARRFLPPAAATLAIALAAINPYLISYAAECKQYAIDASLAIGLFAAAAGLLCGQSGTRRWVVLGLAGAAAVWFSHPAAFVLAGIGTALFAEAAWLKDRRRMLACLATIGTWVASFGICYVLFLKDLGKNQYLIDYWAAHFLSFPPTSPGDLGWIADHYFKLFATPGGLSGGEWSFAAVAAVLALVGLGSFWRNRWPVAVALVVIVLVTLFASGLRMYPFAGRLLLFLVPLALLVVARGAWAVATALRPTMPLAATGLIALLLAAPAVEMSQHLRRPLRQEQLTEVLAELKVRAQPGDKVYLYWGGVPAFLHYTRDEPFPLPVMLGKEHDERRTAYRDDLRQFIGEPRVWVVFSHRHNAEESLVRAYAEGLGECEEEIHRQGATAFRYDFRGPKPPK